MVSFCQRVNVPSWGVTKCHENVTGVSRECHEVSRECHRMSRERPNPIPSSQTLVRAKSDSLQSNFGSGKIQSPPFKLWLLNRPVRTTFSSRQTVTRMVSRKVTECHRMSRKCDWRVSRNVTRVSRECHGMSRNVTRMSRQCHRMSRNVTTPSPRVSESLEASRARQRVDAVTETHHAGGSHTLGGSVEPTAPRAC